MADSTQDQSEFICPSCGAEIAERAVVCVQCGYHYNIGRQLEEAVPARSRSAGGSMGGDWLIWLVLGGGVLFGLVIIIVAAMWIFSSNQGGAGKVATAPGNAPGANASGANAKPKIPKRTVRGKMRGQKKAAPAKRPPPPPPPLSLKQPRRFFPVEGSFSWIYRRRTGKDTQLVLRANSQGRKMLDGSLAVLTVEQSQDKVEKFWWGMNDQGVFPLAAEPERPRPTFGNARPKRKYGPEPSYRIGFPFSKGLGWVETVQVGFPVKTVKVGMGLENLSTQVKTPAGTFNECVEVRGTGLAKTGPSNSQTVKYEMRIWYAPDVGQVKRTLKQEIQGSGSGGGSGLADVTVELMSYGKGVVVGDKVVVPVAGRNAHAVLEHQRLKLENEHLEIFRLIAGGRSAKAGVEQAKTLGTRWQQWYAGARGVGWNMSSPSAEQAQAMKQYQHTAEVIEVLRNQYVKQAAKVAGFQEVSRVRSVFDDVKR